MILNLLADEGASLRQLLKVWSFHPVALRDTCHC